MRLAAAGLILITILGCDRSSPAPAPASKRAPTLGVEIQRVTPLQPDRRTHIAPNGNGQAFWVQEAEGGRETIFAINEGGLPVATRFANTTVLEHLGKSEGRGSIQSLAVGADGKLYFYFSGGTKRQLIATFGCFSPESGKTQILADTATLARESRLGDSLALARGSIVRLDDVLWLWLRHDDAYVLFSLDAKRAGSGLRQPFETVRDSSGEALRLTSSTDDLATGPGKSLAYLDRRTARLWKIGPLGDASLLADFGDPPAALSTPALDDRGRLILFAPEPATPVEQPIIPATRPTTEYPALAILNADGQRTLFGRNAFTAPDRINLRALAPPQLVRDRAGWLAYDPQSGELLRLRLVER